MNLEQFLTLKGEFGFSMSILASSFFSNEAINLSQFVLAEYLHRGYTVMPPQTPPASNLPKPEANGNSNLEMSAQT